MATQYSSKLRLALPVQGELSGAWGNVVNDEITSLIEEAVAGRVIIDSWTANAHTLTTTNGASDEARAMLLKLTDTGTALSGAGQVICPSTSKVYFVENDTGQTITVKTLAGTGFAILNGSQAIVFCDGTDVQNAIDVQAVDVAYDNTSSGRTATQVQAAIDEAFTEIDTVSGTVSGLGTAASEDIVTSSTDITAGRIPTMGYAGLIGNTALSGAGVNADNVALTSIYAVDGTTTGTLPVTPAAGDLLLTLAVDSNDLIQVYYDQSGSPDEYKRKIVAGTPGSWVQNADVERSQFTSTEVTGTSATISSGAVCQNVTLTNSGTVTITLNNDFTNQDLIVLNKQLDATALTVNTTGGDTITYPDGTTDTSATLSAQKAVIYFLRSGGNNFDLNVVN